MLLKDRVRRTLGHGRLKRYGFLYCDRWQTIFESKSLSGALNPARAIEQTIKSIFTRGYRKVLFGWVHTSYNCQSRSEMLSAT